MPALSSNNGACARLLRLRRGQRATTAPHAAAARVVARIVVAYIQTVVEKELGATGDPPQSFDLDVQLAGVVFDLVGNAVRRAGVVDVPRGISAVGTVDHRTVRQAEDVGDVVVPVMLVHLVGTVSAACVPADHAAGLDDTCGEDPVAVDPAVADVDDVQWSGGSGH